MGSRLAQLLPECPMLEELSFSQTQNPNDGCGMAALPGVAGSFCRLPSRLQVLALGNLLLGEDSRFTDGRITFLA